MTATYWNKRIAMDYLIQAASIHRRLPDDHGPNGYFSLWPPTLPDNEWERICAAVNDRPTLGSPYAAEVDFSEQVMEWLQLLERPRMQLVWMRANRIPFKILEEEFGRSKPTLWRRVDESLQKIVTHLNRTDPKGEHFRSLRSRT